MHKRTKATAIPMAVKARVYIRDGCRCVVCDRSVHISNACCHYISRARGGLGIEQNIVTLCHDCHADYDNGPCHRKYKEIIRDYLREQYPDWNEADLVYRKGLS